MKRQHLIALLALGGAAVAFLWWKNSAAPSSDAGNDVSSSQLDSLAGTSSSNSSTSMPDGAASSLAQSTASNPAVNSGGTDVANTNDTRPDTNATSTGLPGDLSGVATVAPNARPDYANVSVFQAAYEKFLGRGNKKDLAHTDRRLAAFEKRYERKHKVDVGSSAPVTYLGTPPA